MAGAIHLRMAERQRDSRPQIQTAQAAAHQPAQPHGCAAAIRALGLDLRKHLARGLLHDRDLDAARLLEAGHVTLGLIDRGGPLATVGARPDGQH